MSTPDGTVGYQYVVLRCVPRVEREEFVNVGVVLYSQLGDFLDVGYRVDPVRLRAFAPGLDVTELEHALAGLRRSCAHRVPGREKPGQRFGWLAAPRSTVLQPGPMHGGVTSDPAAELDRLVGRLVG